MYPEKEMLIYHVESSLHAGAGASIGHIDNPLQRETATGIPIVQANGIKGALREFFEKVHSGEQDKIDAVFGKPDGNDGAGAVAFGEARLLFSRSAPWPEYLPMLPAPQLLLVFRDVLQP